MAGTADQRSIESGASARLLRTLRFLPFVISERDQRSKAAAEGGLRSAIRRPRSDRL
jgi:hypothetical protein